jgi:cell division protein FtsL
MDDRQGGFFYDGVAAGREVRAGLARRSAATRPLPLEDLCFFVKPIDNSRLVRVVDPRSRWDLLKMLLGGLFVFALALGYLLPYLGMLRSGYRIQDLQKEHERLAQETRQLQVAEAGLRNPQRIDAIARAQLGMIKPDPAQVSWADGAHTPARPSDMLAQDLSRFAVEGR